MPSAAQVTHPASKASLRATPRKPGTALKRLDRELKQMRPQAGGNVDSQAPANPTPRGRAHLEQLMRMRNAKLVQQSPGAARPGAPTDATEQFRAAQEALRDQQFSKAHELLLKAREIDPGNALYGMYCMWAAFRAGTLGDDGVTELRTALRAKVNDADLKGFVHYALGHLSLAEKKDDAAERFFQKALELDKHNKDAQRHLRLIGLRRKSAEAEQKSNKIFGIEIRGKKP